MTTDERRKLREDCRLVARVIRMDGHPRLAAMVRDMANDHEAMEGDRAAMIAAWPGDEDHTVYEGMGGVWYVRYAPLDEPQRFDGYPTREAAVLAAAGIAPSRDPAPAAPRTEGE